MVMIAANILKTFKNLHEQTTKTVQLNAFETLKYLPIL